MTSMLLFASLALAPTARAPITYQTQAAPLHQVLTELSTVSGEHLRSAGVLKNEPLILSVKDQPLETVKEMIAEAVGGKWTKIEIGWSLQTNKQQEKADRRTADQERARALSRSIAEQTTDRQSWSQADAQKAIADEQKKQNEMLKRLKSEGPADLDPGFFSSINIMGGQAKSSPAGTALKDIAKALDVRALAAVQPGQRTVFSTTANQRQKPLPSAVGRIANDFVKWHNNYAAAYQESMKKKAQAKPGLPNTKAANPNQSISFFGGGPDLKSQPIASLSKVLVIASRPANSPDSLTLEFKAADQSGAIVATSSLSLNGKIEVPQADLNLGSNSLVKLSDRSKQIIRILSQNQGLGSSSLRNVFVGSLGGGGARIKLATPAENDAPGITPELRSLFAAPDKNEPLSWFVSPALIQTAEAAGLNFCCVAPDKSFKLFGTRLAESDMALSEALRLAAESGLGYKTGDNWLVLRSIDRYETRQNRADREDLANLLKKLAVQGYARLSDAARYANDAPTTAGLDESLVSIFSEQTADLLFGVYTDRVYLKLFDSLPKQGLDQTPDGLKFRMSMLAGNQRSLAEEALYSREAPNLFGNTMAISMVVSDGGQPEAPKGPTLMDEPTEAFPTGLPGAGFIDLKAQMSEAVFAQSQKTGKGKFHNTQAFGMQLAFANSGSGLPSSGPDLKSNDMRFKPAMHAMVSINLMLQDKNLGGAPLEDGWVTAPQANYTFDEIPKQFLAKAQEAANQMRTNTLKFGGGKVKPPE